MTKPIRALAPSGGLLLAATATHAGSKTAIDDTKWISISAAIRASFTGQDDGAPNGSDRGRCGRLTRSETSARHGRRVLNASQPPIEVDAQTYAARRW